MKGVIFDLDGVIVSTDEYHYQAWKVIADQEGIYFDRRINNRLRGVSRLDSLNIILERAKRDYRPEEKLALAEKKNAIYRNSLSKLTPNAILPGFHELDGFLKEKNLKMAIGSSSRNTKLILSKIGLLDDFDVIVDGSMIKRSKPDPEVFLLAGSLLGFEPKECYVIEDAFAGVEAANRGGFVSIGVGDASHDEKAAFREAGLKEVLALLSSR
jgi:beta-phosphoglucomutase